MAIKVLHVDRDGVDMPSGSSTPGMISEGSVARIMVWPGVGATKGSLHYVRYGAGHTSVKHQHPHSEDIGFIIEGEGFIIEWDGDEEVARHPFGPGSVLYVEPGTVHSHIATTPLVMVGGPCPPDVDFYKTLGLEW